MNSISQLYHLAIVIPLQSTAPQLLKHNLGMDDKERKETHRVKQLRCNTQQTSLGLWVITDEDFGSNIKEKLTSFVSQQIPSAFSDSL